jgi:TonB family protein
MRQRLVAAFTAVFVLALPSRAAAQDAPTETPPPTPPPAPPPAPQDEAPLTKMPSVKRAINPDFPAGAQEKGVSADVVLELDISETGTVDDARVTSAKATAEGFDFSSAALKAARQLLFEPAEAGDGNPVPVTIQYTMHFTVAATGAVSGTVASRATNAPIAGATVTITAQVDGQWLRTSAQTGPDGRFRFEKLPVATWDIRVQVGGFGTGRTSAAVTTNQVNDVRILLEPPSTNAYDVLVEEDEAKQDAGRDFKDPSKLVTMTPHVSGAITTRGPNAPVARGPAGRGAPPGRGAAGRGGGRGNGPPGGGRGGRGGNGGPGGGRGGNGGPGGGRGGNGGPGGGRGGGGGGFPGGRGGGGGAGGGAGGGGAGGGGAGGGGAGGGAAPAGGNNAPANGGGGNNAANVGAASATAASSRNNLLAYNDVDSTVVGTGGLVLRGMPPGWTAVRLDGIEIPKAFHDGAIRSIMVPGLLQDSKLYTSNYPTEYGNSIGGLITLWSARDTVTTTTGFVDANLADVSGVVRVPITKTLTLSAGGQYSYLDKTMLGFVPRRNDVAIAWVPAYQDGSLHLVWDPSKIVHVSALAFTARDREIDVYANPNNPTLAEPQPGTLVQDVQTYRGILTAEVKPNEEWQGKAIIGIGQDIFVQPTPGYHIQMQRAEERPSVTYTPMKELAVTLGGEYVAEKATGSVSGAAEPINAGISNPPTTRIVLAEHVARSGVGYLMANWQPFKIVELDPGIRLGTYSQTDETYLEPRALARVTLLSNRKYIDRLSLKGAAGIYRQRPSLFETDPQIGTPGLTSMLARQYLVGIEYKPQKETRIELDAFYAQERDVIVRTTATTTPVFSNAGYGSTQGIEIYVDQELWKHVDGWLFYTYATSDLHIPTETTSQSPYDQTHMLGAALGYQLPLGFQVRGRFLYATGLPLTGIAGTIFNSSTAQYVSLTGAPLGTRAPDFEQLDLRVDKTFVIRTVALTTYLDIRNVTNRANVASSYATNYDASRLYYRRGLPILPLFGARADF